MRRPAAAAATATALRRSGVSLRTLAVLALVALLSLSSASSNGVAAAGECASQPCTNGATCVEGTNSYTCTCDTTSSTTWSGALCQCENGGTGTDDANAPCSCAPGYSGFYCEVVAQPCLGNPCGADGTCIDHVTSFTCECDPGVTGNLCQTRIDQCASAPCLNGATCNSNNGYWTCSCVPGFEGLQCQTDVDECAGAPCQHGGTCSENGGDFACACTNGWCGHACQSDCDECASQPCQNGGTCTQPVFGAFSCNCAAGFSGPTCSINIDDCAPQPCHGPATCIDGVNTYTCACASGYTLDTSSSTCVLDDECRSGPCQNGGTCTNDVNAYRCTCADGWSGPQCQTDIDECASNPCQYGSCTDHIAGFTCTCNHPLAVPPNCFLDMCASSPCQSGATCVNTNYGFRCECAPNQVGTLCQTYVDPCGAAANDCQNNATCIRGVFSHTCYCAPGWNGTTCATLSLSCASSPCVAGTCTEIPYGFQCACPSDLYWGDRCQFHNSTKLETDVGSAVPWDNFAGRTGGIIAAIVVFFLIVFCCYKCWKKRKEDYAAYAVAQTTAAAKAAAANKSKAAAGGSVGGKGKRAPMTGAFTTPDAVPGATSSSPASQARLLKIRDKVASIDRILAGAAAGHDVGVDGMSPRARDLHNRLRERAQRIDELSRSGRSAVSGYGADQIGVSIRVPDDLLAHPSRFPEFDTRLIASAAAALVGTAHNAGGLSVGTGAGGDGDDAQAVFDNKLPELVEKATAEPDAADDANIKLDE